MTSAVCTSVCTSETDNANGKPLNADHDKSTVGAKQGNRTSKPLFIWPKFLKLCC